MNANNNRAIKGKIQNKLWKLGFNNVYASNSGSNVLIVRDTPEKLANLKSLFHTITINDKDAYITLGKRNLKTFENQIGE